MILAAVLLACVAVGSAAPATAPSGYKMVANAAPADSVATLKELPLAKCNANAKCIQNNVNSCGKACDADATCSGFAYTVDDVCKLYASTNGEWNLNRNTQGTVLYLKETTINCNGKNEFFSYSVYDESVGSKGCRPYFKEGEKCNLIPYDETKDLKNDNFGCTPGLKCIDDKNGSSDQVYCAKAGFKPPPPFQVIQPATKCKAGEIPAYVALVDSSFKTVIYKDQAAAKEWNDFLTANGITDANKVRLNNAGKGTGKVQAKCIPNPKPNQVCQLPSTTGGAPVLESIVDATPGNKQNAIYGTCPKSYSCIGENSEQDVNGQLTLNKARRCIKF